jgi:hypothetical protein
VEDVTKQIVEKAHPWAFSSRKAKSVIFALLHSRLRKARVPAWRSDCSGFVKAVAKIAT